MIPHRACASLPSMPLRGLGDPRGIDMLVDLALDPAQRSSRLGRRPHLRRRTRGSLSTIRRGPGEEIVSDAEHVDRSAAGFVRTRIELVEHVSAVAASQFISSLLVEAAGWIVLVHAQAQRAGAACAGLVCENT